MKKSCLIIISLFFSLSVLAADNGMVAKSSKYSVAETMDRFEAEAKSKGFAVVARVDHAAAAEKAGLKMPPSQLLIFGNPKGGTPLMLAAPTVAIDLPLKALAWQDGEGKVFLGFNSTGYLKSRHDITGKDDALKIMEGVMNGMAEKAVE